MLDENGNYNITNWETGDLITKPRMNKLEGGVYKNREDINKILKAVDTPPTFTKPTLSLGLSKTVILSVYACVVVESTNGVVPFISV